MQSTASIPPLRVLAWGSALALLALIAAILLAVAPPRLSLSLIVVGEEVVLAEPLAAVGIDLLVPTGERVTGLSADSLPSLEITPFDLTEEPDTLESWARYNRFLDRQSALYSRMQGDHPILHLEHFGPVPLAPTPTHLFDLPPLSGCRG